MDFNRYTYIPFVDKGRDYDGCDCWGIPYLIYRDLRGIELPLYTHEYQNTEDRREIARIVNRDAPLWDEVQSPALFDLILLRLKTLHCGVYIGDGLFIHCLDGVGTVVEELSSVLWRNRIVKYLRYRN